MPNTKQQRNIWHRRKKVCFQHLLVPIKRRSDMELRDGHPSFTLHINLLINWYSLPFFKERFTGKLFARCGNRKEKPQPYRWCCPTCWARSYQIPNDFETDSKDWKLSLITFFSIFTQPTTMPFKRPIINARISGSGGSFRPETKDLYRKRLVCP